MDINRILLVGSALLPAIGLAIYIYKKDRAEKEPIELLLCLFFLGIVSCFPAMHIENLSLSLIDGAFGITDTNFVFPDRKTFLLYEFFTNFAGVALVEEGLKWLVLYLFTRKNKNFNSLFDGIIYAVFVSLGFAAYENVLYVIKYGFQTAITRALTAVPGHMFFGVIMGYYYTVWNVYEKARKQELKLIKERIISPHNNLFSGNKLLLFSFLAPVSIHGLYDFCCSIQVLYGSVILILLICFLYCYCFYQIKELSKKDKSDVSVSLKLLINKYPALAKYIRENY